MSGREATWLVVRREITERLREKAFAVSTGINIVIIVAVVIVAAVLGERRGELQGRLVLRRERARRRARRPRTPAARSTSTIEARQIGSPGAAG